jgi:hypothetical protein
VQEGQLVKRAGRSGKSPAVPAAGRFPLRRTPSIRARNTCALETDLLRCEDLGINPNMAGKWRSLINKFGSRDLIGQGHVRDDEMMRLKRELARMKKERDFLKAAAYFAKELK